MNKCLHAALPVILMLCALPAQAGSSITRFEYDAMGNGTKVSNGLGYSNDWQYDGLHRPVQWLQPAAPDATRPNVATSYDGQDRLTAVTDPRRLLTAYTVDGLGNLTALRSPDSGHSDQVYDAAGNLVSRTDARGKTTRYAYDALNRVSGMTDAAGKTTTYGYDQAGLLETELGPDGESHYRHDGFDRIWEKANVINGKTLRTVYTYGESQKDDEGEYMPGCRMGAAGKTLDAGGRPQQIVRTGAARSDWFLPRDGACVGRVFVMIYPSGHLIAYQYDDGGRLVGMSLYPNRQIASAALLRDIRYQAGQAVAWQWGDKPDQRYRRERDLQGRVSGYSAGDGSYRAITYDAAGRISAMTTEGRAPSQQTYGYDPVNRLSTATNSTTRLGYRYDSNGNRIAHSVGDAEYGHTIAADSNRLLQTSSPASQRQYDAAGNLLSDGVNSYTYNDLGRLASVTGAAGTVRYAYNGLGQRIRKSGPENVIATGSVSYVYDEQGKLLGEYDADGKMLQETVYLGNTPVIVLKPKAGTQEVDIYNVHADHLNTPRAITNQQQQLVWRWDNGDPFGMNAADENPANLGNFVYNLRFPGQLYDTETKLHYNYFRDYDPVIGRYVQSDPIGLAGGINTYAYVNGNPVSLVDPLGLWTLSASFFRGVGGGIDINYQNGTLEIMGRLGVGLGGGVSFDVNGGPSPDSRQCSSGWIARSYGDIGISLDAGPISVGLSRTLHSGNAITTPVGGVRFPLFFVFQQTTTMQLVFPDSVH